MFRKKNIVIGISGFLICIGLAILGLAFNVAFLSSTYVACGFLALGLFFFGFIFGGILTGFYVSGGVIVIILASLFPERFRGLFVLAVLVALVIISNQNDIKQLLKIGSKKTLVAQGRPTLEEEEESQPDESLKLQEIYLIKPNATKPDVVYKVFMKDGRLFFCKVGGQFYNISDKTDFNVEMLEEELLRPKQNFAISKADIVSVSMDPKPRRHTGPFPNNGTVNITVGGKPVKYLIYPVHSCKGVEVFFREQCRITPEIRDRGNPREEAFDRQIKHLRQEAPYDIKKVRKVVKVVNVMAFIAMLWAWLYPEPYEVVIIVNILFMVFAVFVSIRFKAAVNVYSDKKEIPQLFVLLWPTFGLVIRSMMDCNLLYTTGAWVCLGILAILMALFIYLNTNEYLKKKWLAVFLPLLCFGAVYGAVITTDYTFDFSQPKQYRTIIVDKRIDDGKTTSFHLTLEPWGDVKGQKDAIVSESFYNRKQIGQSIYVYEMNGLWGIHWYYPSDKNN